MSKNKLIIKKENEIIIIRKDNVQQLVYKPEYSYEGYVISIYTQPEQYFVVMTNGDKFTLTKKQYKAIKQWY